MTASKERRLFFALWPDEATREIIARYTAEAIRNCGGRAVPDENFHITLRFIGNVDEAGMKRLKTAAARTPADPVRLKLDRMGYWEGPQVFWLGCRKAPDALLRLVVNLNTELGSEGFPAENRPFRPHVTLVRKADSAPDGQDLEPVVWTSDEFVLVESETGPKGSAYRVLERWPLGSEPA